MIGIIKWIWDSFLASMDVGTIKLVNKFLGVDFSDYTGLGIGALLIIAFTLGVRFIPTRTDGAWQRQHMGHFIFVGTLIGLFTKVRFRHKPIIWTVKWTSIRERCRVCKMRGEDSEQVHVRNYINHPPQEADHPFVLDYVEKLERGWLLDVRYQWITLANGERKRVIIYKTFVTTANNPSSGNVFEEEDPSCIKYIADHSTGRLIADTLSFGLAVSNWDRREFDPSEFPPHNPEDPTTNSPGKEG